MSAALNIRHGLSEAQVHLFKVEAVKRGMTHGEFLGWLLDKGCTVDTQEERMSQ